ncbi:hypothetical protein [Novipirellula caenicola]|uniref:Uncharacterized protein n=1 Tax=Novipirellula caenicola TaxID=1536901 RepID=A0ABP9VQH4_9BACT
MPEGETRGRVLAGDIESPGVEDPLTLLHYVFMATSDATKLLI